MIQEYKGLQEQLEKVNFDLAWKGFHEYPFALYNDEWVYFEKEQIPYDTRFLGNSTICYEGQQIAIWRLGDGSEKDYELWASMMVHEMFHAHQMTHGETRFPKDLESMMYPDVLENWQMKYWENQMMAQAINEGSSSAARKLEEIGRSREHRKSLIGEFIECEQGTETTEGIAEFVGMEALRQINTAKYRTKIQDYANHMKKLDKSQLQVRGMAYWSGVLLLTLAREARLSIEHELTETRYLSEILAERQSSSSEGRTIERIREEAGKIQGIEKLLAEEKEEKKTKINCFFRGTVDRQVRKRFHENQCRICGYDPMNMIRMDDQILCTNFIMLQEVGEEPEFTKGPVLLRMETGSVDKVCEIWV